MSDLQVLILHKNRNIGGQPVNKMIFFISMRGRKKRTTESPNKVNRSGFKLSFSPIWKLSNLITKFRALTLNVQNDIDGIALKLMQLI